MSHLTLIPHRAHALSVAAKSVTGRENPSNTRRNGAATALFCCVTPASSMAGVSGRLRPGRVPRIPVSHPGTSVAHRVRTIGGGSNHTRIPS